MDGFEELRKKLLALKYDADLVDDVLARMRAEEECEARRPATVQDDSQTNLDEG